jgi:hypothetical protein
MRTDTRKFHFKKSEIPASAWADILSLHGTYFLDETISSSVTSSHWDHYSNFQSVTISEDEIGLHGFGFGDYENFRNLSFFRKIINFPMSLGSNVVLVQTPLNIRSAVRCVAISTSRSINPDLARLAKSLQMISLVVPDFSSKKRIAIIGDGFGTLGSLLATINPEATIVQINLGRQLLFDYCFMITSNPTRKHKILKSLSEIDEGSVNYLPAESLSILDAEIDVFISSESFQEMDMKVIGLYFELMRVQTSQTYFYCANRISKKLPDGKIIEMEKYGWSINDINLSINSHWWLNWGIKRRPPFFFKMDGRIEERITVISKC